MTSAPGMEPRIRARRVEVLRAQGRRRLYLLLSAVLLAAALGCIWGVSRTGLLDVDSIVVSGVSGVDRAEVLREAGLSLGTAMIDLRPGDTALAIASLPWVVSADVRRQWPSTIHVQVKPRMPVAVVPAGTDTVVLVDAYGYAISRRSGRGLPIWDGDSAGSGTVPSEPAVGVPVSSSSDTGESGEQVGLSAADTAFPSDSFRSGDPFLVGDSLRAISAAELPLILVPFDGELGDVHSDAGPGLSVVAALTEDLRSWVELIRVGPKREVSLALAGGATAVLGEPALLDDKIAALRALLAGVELECIVSIDVTMADLATVVRHPSCMSAQG